jgi:hypothetical protein
MAKKKSRRAAAVREPIQVYLTAEERTELDRLASDEGISRAEVLRRGIRSYALESAGGDSPVLNLITELKGNDWPSDVASNHDDILADAYRERGVRE